MHTLTLRRPARVEDQNWAAVEAELRRVNRAIADGDHAATIGSLKDLCESVAKVVLVARHELVPAGADFGPLISAAHKSLDREPGKGAASDEASKRLMAGVRSMVTALAELRNQHGTGHGRAELPPTTAEHAELAFDAARTWCAWALRRLDTIAQRSVDTLIDDVEHSVFYGGQLSQRLAEVGLETVEENDLRRLGRAVAQRGGHGGTGVVWREGVVDAIENPDRFPAAYRNGLMEGLILDRNGYVRTTPNQIDRLAQLAVQLGDVESLVWLSEDVNRADLAYAFDLSEAEAITQVVSNNAMRFTRGSMAQAAWNHIGDRFRAVSPSQPDRAQLLPDA